MRAANSLLYKGIFQFGDFRLNASEGVLEREGRPIPVAPKALDVLLVLIQNRGRIVEKERLMGEVWPGVFVEENNLAFNISVLRKVFGDSGAAPRYIETVPKRGYRFIANVVEVSDAVLSAARPRGEDRHQEPDIPPVPVARDSRLPRRRILLTALVAVALSLIGILASGFFGTPKLTDKDTIVLAEFVNKTGDPVFDGTLHQGLAVELEQSPFLSLISAPRVRQMLLLMKQPADALLTAELAREVCLRVGSAAVLEGTIATIGTQYVLGFTATNCAGEVLENQQVQVRRKEDVLNALTELAHRFRSRIGESPAMLRKHDVPLAEATTKSLEALRAYSAAWEIHGPRGAINALPLLKRATELDPHFAMAHASLGRMYADLDESDLAAESIRKAWQLRDRTSDREKFFITSNYQMLVTGNLEAARNTAEAWARTYPRDSAPHAILSSSVNKVPGRYENAVAEASQAIALDPDFGIGYYNLAVDNAYLGRLDEAESALRSAAQRGLEIDELLMLAFDIAFLKNDSARMERVSARARGRSGPASWISNKEAFALAYSGRLQQARSMSRRAVAEAQEAEQRERAALWEAAAAVREGLYGNTREAIERSSAALRLSPDREAEYGAAFSLALAGDSRRSKQITDELEKRFPEDTSVRFSYLPVLRAQLALNRGEPVKAIEELQTAVANEFGVPRSTMHALFGALYPIYVRGEAYMALHQGAGAAVEFQKILDRPGIVLADPIGVLAHLQLGRALVLARETSKAQTAYWSFLTLWKSADPDIPVLKQARSEFAKLK